MAFPSINSRGWQERSQPYNAQIDEQALRGRIMNLANEPPLIGGPYDSTRALEEDLPPRLQGDTEPYDVVKFWESPSLSDRPGVIKQAYAELRPAHQWGSGAFIDGGAYVPSAPAQEETFYPRSNIVQNYSPNLDMLSVINSRSFSNLLKTFREPVDDDALKNFDVGCLGEQPDVAIVYWLRKLSQCEEFKNDHARPAFCRRVLSILLFATESPKYLEIFKTVALETSGDIFLGLDRLELERKQ